MQTGLDHFPAMHTVVSSRLFVLQTASCVYAEASNFMNIFVSSWLHRCKQVVK